MHAVIVSVKLSDNPNPEVLREQVVPRVKELPGFVAGYWTRDGDRWVIKAEGVRQDGQHASATNVITRLGKDRASWKSVDRTIGGAAVPGIDEFTIVRKPPEAGQ